MSTRRLIRSLPRNRWIDITVPIRHRMVHWPGDPPVRIEPAQQLARGDSSNSVRLSMGSHTATHMDAPRHFFRNGATLDRIPPSRMIGPARVIAIRHPRAITVEELRPHRIRAGQRLLFKTRNSSHGWKTSEFLEDFVYVSTEAARFLADCDVGLVGVDYLSIGGYRAKNGVTVHRTLLARDVCIIEGLNLSRVKAGRYFLVCLPLRILDADGAPARALLAPLR